MTPRLLDPAANLQFYGPNFSTWTHQLKDLSSHLKINGGSLLPTRDLWVAHRGLKYGLMPFARDPRVFHNAAPRSRATFPVGVLKARRRFDAREGRRCVFWAGITLQEPSLSKIKAPPFWAVQGKRSPPRARPGLATQPVSSVNKSEAAPAPAPAREATRIRNGVRGARCPRPSQWDGSGRGAPTR